MIFSKNWLCDATMAIFPEIQIMAILGKGVVHDSKKYEGRLRQSNTPLEGRSEDSEAVLLQKGKPFLLTHCSPVNVILKGKKTQPSQFNLIHFHVRDFKCPTFYDTQEILTKICRNLKIFLPLHKQFLCLHSQGSAKGIQRFVPSPSLSLCLFRIFYPIQCARIILFSSRNFYEV